jgi:hypothetical protein
MASTDEAPPRADETNIPARLQNMVSHALPGARILRVVPLKADADGASAKESAKGAGYGAPLRLDIFHEGKPRSLVLHTATANQFGHERRADRAQSVLLAADTFGLVPRHVAVVDVGAYREEAGFTSLLDSGEFYVMTSHSEGHVYAEDLRHIARSGCVSDLDKNRHLALVDYLVQLHRECPAEEKSLYARSIRDTLGSGEGLFGISDSYPDEVPEAPRARLERIEEAGLRQRFRLRKRSERLRRIHGDFHPFNVLFDAGAELAVLDTSRGSAGDPADDVTCMAINFPFFALGQSSAWRDAFAPLWHEFWRAYVARTNDDAIYEAAPLFIAWRGLVLASPIWYPELTPADRNRVLSFVEATLAAPRFSPGLADE